MSTLQNDVKKLVDQFLKGRNEVDVKALNEFGNDFFKYFKHSIKEMGKEDDVPSDLLNLGDAEFASQFATDILKGDDATSASNFSEDFLEAFADSDEDEDEHGKLTTKGSNKLLRKLYKNKIELLGFILEKMNEEQLEKLIPVLIQNRSVKSLDLRRLNRHDTHFKLSFIEGLSSLLTQNSTLTSLDLLGNELVANEVALITKALIQNTTVLSLNLSMNNFGHEGVKFIADVLTRNTTLKTLLIYGIDLYVEDVKLIADAISKNASLTSLWIGCKQQFFVVDRCKQKQFGIDEIKLLKEAFTVNTTVTELHIYDGSPQEKNLLEKEIDPLLKRNKDLELFRQKYIESLSITPLLSKPVGVDVKESVELETDIHTQYKNALQACQMLESEKGYSTFIIDQLKAEALLNYCRWDQGHELSSAEKEKGGLTTFERIQKLKELSQSTINIPFKGKVLEVLSTIALDLGIVMKAKEYFLLAYTCQRHTEKWDNSEACRAFRFWLDNPVFDNTKSCQELELELLQESPDKFKQYRENYEAHCKELNVTPLNLNPLNANRTDSRSSAERADSKSNMDALVPQFKAMIQSHRSAGQVEILGLDCDEEDVTLGV